jgi:hypothetical protein
MIERMIVCDSLFVFMFFVFLFVLIVLIVLWSLRGAIPFDFSEPSPDDIVLEAQRMAFKKKRCTFSSQTTLHV